MANRKYQADNGDLYLTKRDTVRLARAAGVKAAAKAMNVMGFVVVAENGWVIRKYNDGRKERIAPVEQ